MAEKNPLEGHRKRLRVDYRRNALAGLQPHVQAELLLSFAIPRKDTKDMGRQLIKQFKSLRGILDADYDSLTAVEGVGERTATLIMLTGEIARRYETYKPNSGRWQQLTADNAGEYAAGQIGRNRAETLLVVCLDAKFRILRSQTMAAGTATGLSVRPRAVMRLALECDAASVVIAHNHPRGTPMPSQKDITEAGRLKKMLEEFSIGLVDFIIVGEGKETYSLLRSGLV